MVRGERPEQAGGDEGSGDVDADQHPRRGVAPDRSEMERWDDISAEGSGWKAFDNTIDPGINPFVRCLQSLLPQPPQPMQIDEQQPPESNASQGPSQPQQSRLQEITRTAAALGKQRVLNKDQALAIGPPPVPA